MAMMDLEMGEPEKRQESVTIEDGDMSREVGDRCADPPDTNRLGG